MNGRNFLRESLVGLGGFVVGASLTYKLLYPSCEGLDGLDLSEPSHSEEASLETALSTRYGDTLIISGDYLKIKEKILASLKQAKSNLYDLSKVYEEGSPEDLVQMDLRSDTHFLSAYLHHRVNWTKSDAADEIEDSLPLLADVRDIFGDHPFHHVIEGRLKDAIHLAARYHCGVPRRLQQFVGAEIPPWQDPQINYRILDDIRHAALERGAGVLEYIPPEFRQMSEFHQM